MLKAPAALLEVFKAWLEAWPKDPYSLPGGTLDLERRALRPYCRPLKPRCRPLKIDLRSLKPGWRILRPGWREDRPTDGWTKRQMDNQMVCRTDAQNSKLFGSPHGRCPI